MTDISRAPATSLKPLVTPILYLSGAPRLSTKSTTESLGPRSHILGVIDAFRGGGASVEQFVVGDEVPQSFHAAGSEARMTASIPRRVGADVGRLVYRTRSRLRLRRTLKASAAKPALAYERYALMQELGSVAQARGATWVLEVNALLAVESTSERRATSSRRIATHFERRTLRRADLLVAVTDQLKTAIHTSYGIALDRIVVVENGVDTSKYGHAAAELHETPTIGFLGTLYPWQRVDELLRAVERSSGPWVVRIAGEGPEYSSLKRLAGELGIENRVTFLGRVHPDQVPAFLETVDLCYAGHGSATGVYFSPLKLWEYLAAGKPVIASRHETTDRLNASGYAVTVFDGSEGSLDDALRTAAVGLPSLLSKAVEDQELVAESHSWKARVEPLLRRVQSLRASQ